LIEKCTEKVAALSKDDTLSPWSRHDRLRASPAEAEQDLHRRTEKADQVEVTGQNVVKEHVGGPEAPRINYDDLHRDDPPSRRLVQHQDIERVIGELKKSFPL
jgi:hypothetical protein